MSNPIFTVIIATYNRKELLPQAISSVLNQTFKDFELLVIDNGSTDNTRSVVEQINDPRVKYILNPKPTNSCDAPRNLGIELAKGSLISFLDDDDIWYPERLEKVKKALDKNPYASAVCHYENRNINGKIDAVYKHGPWTNDIYERLLYKGNCLSPCATTIRSEILRQFNGFDLRKEFDAAADYDLWLRMTAKGVKIHFLEEPLGEFNVTDNNKSLNNPAFQLRLAFLIKEHILSYEEKSIFLLSEKGMWRLFKLYSIAGEAFINTGKYVYALKCFLKAMLFLIIRPILIIRLFRRQNKNYLTYPISYEEKLSAYIC